MKEAKQLPLEQNGAKEEERVCFWEELRDVDDEQWWNNMVVAELGVVEKQQQESQPAAWLDEDDDTRGEQPISSSPRGALSGTQMTFSGRAFIDGMHRQAGDAQRGRTFQAVAQEGGTGEYQEAWWWIGVRLLRGAWGGAWMAEKALSATRAST